MHAANAILAPHRPLRERIDANSEEWRQVAASKIDEARATFDATARRSKKGRQPSSPVPQLWSEDEVEEQFVRGSGAGGQKINKTSCCVLITVRALLVQLHRLWICSAALMIIALRYHWSVCTARSNRPPGALSALSVAAGEPTHWTEDDARKTRSACSWWG